MKKLYIIVAAILVILGISVTGCSTNSKTKTAKRSESKPVKIVKHTKKNKPKVRKKITPKKVISKPEQNQTTSNQKTNTNQKNVPDTSATQNNTGNQQVTSPDGIDRTLGGKLPPATSFSDFINKYGESPALYLSQHYGMNTKQALEATPDDMKDSGEKQTQYNLEIGRPIN